MTTVRMLMFAVVSLFVIGFVQMSSGNEGKSAIEGIWDLNEIVSDGTPFLPEKVKEVKWIVAGNKMAIVPPDSISKEMPKQELSFTLNSATSPKSIDVTNVDGPYKGKTFAGIYKIEGDTLTLCIRVDPADETRPTGFESKEGSKLVVYAMQRAKP